MNRSYSYRLVALIMAVMVLVSTTGVALDMHCCQGKIKTVSIFGQAPDCATMAEKVKSSHCKKKLKQCLHVDKKNTEGTCQEGCCEQKSIDSKLDANLPLVTIPNLDNESTWDLAYAINRSQAWDMSETFSYSHYCYHPPPLIRNLSILNQVFRL